MEDFTMQQKTIPEFIVQEEPAKEKNRKLAIICSKGSLDMAYPGLVLANAARMMGIVERAVELSETKYCSARAMLAQVVPIQHVIRIKEEPLEEELVKEEPALVN